MRKVSEKEFINYAKSMGNFCTYRDASKAVKAVTKSLVIKLGLNENTALTLLSSSLSQVWADWSGVADDNQTASSLSITELVKFYGEFSTQKQAEIALLAFFGTIKEKQASFLEKWEEVLSPEIRYYFDKSSSIDIDDPAQCL